jgi:hypothetical protein
MATTPVCKKGFLIVAMLAVLSLLCGCTTLPRSKGCMDEPLRNYVVPSEKD